MKMLPFRIIRNAAFGIFFICLQASAQSASGAKYLFPKGKDVHFFADHTTGSEFMLFDKDGTYAEFSREHMFVAQMDSGRWIQQNNGEILMCSDHKYKPIAYGSRIMNVIQKETYDSLPGFRNILSQFLSNNSAGSFSKGQLSTLRQGRFADVIDDLPEPTRRKTLEDLRLAIDTYLASNNVNLSKAQTWAYRGKIFLVGHNPWAPTRKQLKADLDKGKKAYLVSTATIRIDADRFHKLIGTTQPFVYDTNMNEATKGLAKEIMDMRPTKISPQCEGFQDQNQ